MKTEIIKIDPKSNVFTCINYIISNNGFIYYIMRSVYYDFTYHDNKHLQQCRNLFCIIKDKYEDNFVPLIIGMDYKVSGKSELKYTDYFDINNTLSYQIGLPVIDPALSYPLETFCRLDDIEVLNYNSHKFLDGCYTTDSVTIDYADCLTECNPILNCEIIYNLDEYKDSPESMLKIDPEVLEKAHKEYQFLTKPFVDNINFQN